MLALVRPPGPMTSSGIRIIRRLSNDAASLKFPALHKDFVIGLTQAEHSNKYVDFMFQNFLPRNDLYKGLGLSPDDPSLQKYTRKRIKRRVASGVSCTVTHLPSNQLAGIVFCQILTKENLHTFHDPDLYTYSKPVQDLDSILKHLSAQAKAFEDPSVNKVLEVSSSAVDPEFAGNKLLPPLILECTKHARQLGCQMAVGLLTNLVSQGVLQKMNAEYCYEMDYENYRIGGKKVIDISKMEEGTTTAHVLKIDLRKF